MKEKLGWEQIAGKTVEVYHMLIDGFSQNKMEMGS
jgi:hypothetical protein